MNPYIGHEHQISGVEEHRLVGGKGDGMRLFEITNGKGLEMTVCNLVRRTEKGRLRRRGWGLRWEKAQKGGKGTNLRGFFED